MLSIQHLKNGHANDDDITLPESNQEDLSQLPKSLRVLTRQFLQLPPPDSFTGFLDKVELALLQQVRSKSIAFFHETNEFRQLKEWIAGLVEEV